MTYICIYMTYIHIYELSLVVYNICIQTHTPKRRDCFSIMWDGHLNSPLVFI